MLIIFEVFHREPVLGYLFHWKQDFPNSNPFPMSSYNHEVSILCDIANECRPLIDNDLNYSCPVVIVIGVLHLERRS